MLWLLIYLLKLSTDAIYCKLGHILASVSLDEQGWAVPDTLTGFVWEATNIWNGVTNDVDWDSESKRVMMMVVCLRKEISKKESSGHGVLESELSVAPREKQSAVQVHMVPKYAGPLDVL